MPSRETQMRAFAMLGLVMLLWAGNSIIGRAVRDDVPPFTLALIRWAGALLVLTPFALATVWRDRAAILARWKAVLVLGVLGVGAFNGLLYLGLHYTTATNALLMQAAIPAMVMLLDLMFFGTRAGPVQVAGVALSILGVAGIVFEGDPAAALRLHLGKGDALVLIAVVVWSLYTVLLRLRPAISPVSFIWVTFAIGVLTMAPPAFAEWHAGKEILWSPGVLGAFLYVCLLPSLASYFIYNWATDQVGPARAGQAITMMPLFGALLSALLLGEKLHGYHLAGMALILAGIVAGALAPRPREAAQDSAGAP
ncbi:MAG: permease [Shinella sp. 65-6]|nr:MAG: permease [Shinella sp. 65-6]